MHFDTAYADFIVLKSGTQILLYASSWAGAGWDVASGRVFGTISAGNWYHVALVRSGNTFYTFLNGTLGESWVNSSSLLNPIGAIYVGSGVGSQYFDGYIDEVRLRRGVAEWTSSFDPPTAPYTDPALSVGGGSTTGGGVVYLGSTLGGS